jgi:hypothetical protein
MALQAMVAGEALASLDASPGSARERSATGSTAASLGGVSVAFPHATSHTQATSDSPTASDHDLRNA